MSLTDARAAYRRWLGRDYDIGVLDVVLCTAAAQDLTGDPPWLLVIGGPGSGKTETIAPLEAAGAIVVSTISGEAALLSGTPVKEQARDATGGLLGEIGRNGMLVIKDVTSILSMNRDTRSQVLAALREIHDGSWTRRVGTEGGRVLTWSGRLVIIGACTTAWDSAHSVIAAMGDRFLLVRPTTGVDLRRAAGRQAMQNVASETEMRAELAAVVEEVLTDAKGRAPVLTEEENESVLDLADLISRARTAVQRGSNGVPTFAHAAEMPTRLAKQLAQVARGGLALGMSRGEALAVAERCAADTMPPMRLLLLADVAAHPDTATSAVTARLQLPNSTVDRVLQELQLLRLLTVDSIAYGSRTRWVYSLAGDVGRDALDRLAHGGGTDIPGKPAFPRNVSTPPWGTLPPLPPAGDTEHVPGCDGKHLRYGPTGRPCKRTRRKP
jgi:hypothetical protein